MGIATVAVYSEADRDALHVELADEAVASARRPAASRICDRRAHRRRKQTGAEAVHPGYGFLSENAVFARASRRRASSSSARSTRRSRPWATRSRRRSWPPRRGQHHPGPQRRDRQRGARRSRSRAKIGYPVMIKASAGGGGKGLRVAYDDREAAEGFASCRSEARGQLRRRPRLHREVRRGAAPHRDPGARRRARPLRLPVGARVLDPAPAPEGGRGGAVPLSRRGDAQGDGRAGGGARQGGELPVGGHRRVRRRQGPELLLPRDEHAAAGRAPGDGVHHRARPRRADDPRRRRRAARLHASRGRAPRLGDRVPRQRRGSLRGFLPSTGRLVAFRPPATTLQAGDPGRRAPPAFASTPASTKAARSRSTTTR